MSRLARRVAEGMLSAVARLLPSHMTSWSRAMAHELVGIADDRSALLFAAGCLRAAISLALAHRLRSAFAATKAILFPTAPLSRSFPMNRISSRPRLLGLFCAAAAVAVGMAYMNAAGAPSRYPLMNFAALVLGATAWLALGPVDRSRDSAAGPAILALSVPLLLTAWFGVEVEGVSRWVSVGPLNLQLSLILLPAMIVLYARRPGALGTAGMVAAALALALQPDRGMAGVLAAALLAVALETKGRLPILAASASVSGFGWTFLTVDGSPASAFVDQVLYSAFDVHPIAGAAVLVGAAALAAPGAIGLWRGGGDRAALLAFGACWSGAVAAAALGNYPTPLVGYGGSAVLGYLLSVALLPGGARETNPGALESPPAAGPAPDPARPELRAARPA